MLAGSGVAVTVGAGVGTGVGVASAASITWSEGASVAEFLNIANH